MSEGESESRRAGVVAVITSFNPGQDLVTVCGSVIGQVGRVIVVDDGSTADVEQVLTACAALGADIVRHPVNRGIAAALNSGLAAAPGSPFYLTLDQDSRVPDGYVDALLDASVAVPGARVAMVGPGSASGVRTYAPSSAGARVLDLEPIQSGLLLVGAAVDDLGGFEDDLFIDGVDTEYWLRARRAGWVSVVTPGAALEHQLGRRHQITVAGRTIGVTHAAPFRYYFIARNRVALVRRYGRTEKRWAIGAIGRDVRHLLITTMLVPGRLRRLRETASGLRDGFRGRLGPHS